MTFDNDDSIVIATAMMDDAAAFLRFAQAARRDYVDAKTDPVLLRGASNGMSVLLALATETALKAWQCRDSGDHDRTHDLLELYESERITPASRSTIAAALEGVPIGAWPDIFRAMPWLEMRFPTDAETYIRAVLKYHAKTFIEARYATETLVKKRALMVETPQIEHVLEALIRAYHRASP